MANNKIVPMTDDTRFHGGTEIEGKKKIQGTYDMGGPYQAHYSLSRQKETAAVPLRGTVSLRGADNVVLIVADAAGNMVEARLPISMQSTEAEDIKKEIAEKAHRLYARFAGIETNKKAYIPIINMSFAEITNTYGEEYAGSKSPGNVERQKARLRSLRDVAANLSATQFGRLSQRQIGELCAQLEETWYDKIREADMFMQYVIERRKYEQIHNPFEKYRESHIKPRNTKALQQNAVSTDVLSHAEQDKIIDLVLAHLDESDYAGIGLLLGTGLEAKQVVALRYGDIYEDPDNKGVLIVDYHRPDLVGSMHDFSFVLSGLGKWIYQERRKKLEQNGLLPEEINKRSILTNSETLYHVDKLSMACRNVLHNCGVGFAQMAGLTSNREGAGVRLLRSTYGLRLKDEGGLDKDPSLYQYMMHNRPDGTQGVYYRSFTDVYARRCQAIVHRRIKWFPTEKRNSVFTMVNGENKKTQTVKLNDDERTVEATVQIRLRAGQYIKITSGYGVRTSWQTELLEPGAISSQNGDYDLTLAE